MKLEGKCCKPANETEYELMKTVAIAAGYDVARNTAGFSEVNPVAVFRHDGNFWFGNTCTGNRHEQITLHDWVFKATHKDTGELIVPEWADAVFYSDGVFFVSIGFSKAEVIGGATLIGQMRKPETIITRQQEPEQSWHERGELPPVGTECEGFWGGGWRKVEVLKVVTNSQNVRVAACRVAEGNDENVGPLKWIADFRPISKKSPRDEWIKSVDEIAEKQPCNHTDLFGAIYDALKSGKLKNPRDMGEKS